MHHFQERWYSLNIVMRLDKYSIRPDVMDSGLEADILKIPKDISKMWVWATTLRKLPVLHRTSTYPNPPVSYRLLETLRWMHPGSLYAKSRDFRAGSFFHFAVDVIIP